MPASTDYLPRRESDLVTWAANFDQKLTTTVGAYGLSPGQVTAYSALNASWQSSYVAANDNSTRTPSSIQTKNDAKEALINGPNGIRELAQFIQNNPATTNTERSDLGLTVPDVDPTPIPVPEFAPLVTVAKSEGRTFELRLRDVNNPDKRARPAGVRGAAVYSFVGPNAPEALSQWQFRGNTNRTDPVVEFPVEVAAGEKVWFIAQWFNPNTQSGPASTPIFSYIQFGDVAEAA